MSGGGQECREISENYMRKKLLHANTGYRLTLEKESQEEVKPTRSGKHLRRLAAVCEANSAANAPTQLERTPTPQPAALPAVWIQSGGDLTRYEEASGVTG